MYNKYYNDKDNNYGEKRIDPYSRDRRYNNENDFNKNNDLTSPLKISSSLLMNRNKERFQNENLTVHRVSPVHYQNTKQNFMKIMQIITIQTINLMMKEIIIMKEKEIFKNQ